MAINCLAKVHQWQSCPQNPCIGLQQVNLHQKRFLRVCIQSPKLRMGIPETKNGHELHAGKAEAFYI